MGDRKIHDTKHWITNYSNNYGKKPNPPSANPSITAYRNNWNKKQIIKMIEQ